MMCDIFIDYYLTVIIVNKIFERERALRCYAVIKRNRPCRHYMGQSSGNACKMNAGLKPRWFIPDCVCVTRRVVCLHRIAERDRAIENIAEHMHVWFIRTTGECRDIPHLHWKWEGASVSALGYILALNVTRI